MKPLHPDCKTTDLGSGIPAVVEFGAAWCPPCRQLEPLLADLAARYAGEVDVFTADVGELPRLAERFGVRSLPTVLAVTGGRVIAQQVGYSRQAIESLFETLAGRSGGRSR